MRAGQTHPGAEERVGQRALFPGPLPGAPDHAGRADPRGDGAGRRADLRQQPEPARERHLLLRRHRRCPLQAAGAAGRPARARRHPRAPAAQRRQVRLRGARRRRRGGRSHHPVRGAARLGRMSGRIHPTAIVAPGARIAPDVEVGPYCVIGGQVEVGEGTWIGAHVVLDGILRIGKRNKIYHFASLGAAPQDKKYAGEDTRVEIGDGNTIREYVTINRGTAQDVGVTRLGDDNWLMAYVHLAHDCQVGSHTIFANCTQLAGHVTIEDWVILGGFSAVHQYVRIGAHAFTGMGSAMSQDVPPYVTAAGNLARPFGLNTNGLKRRGFSEEAMGALKRAYRTLYRAGLSLEQAKRELEAQAAASPEVRVFLDFITRSKRGFIR